MPASAPAAEAALEWPQREVGPVQPAGFPFGRWSSDTTGPALVPAPVAAVPATATKPKKKAKTAN